MKKYKLVLNQVLAFSVSVVFFACNDSAEQKADDTTKAADSTTAATTATTPAPAAFEPFDVAEISHKVKDYDKWRPFFNADSTMRRESGLQDMVVGRNLDDPNKILIALQASDVKKAKDFGATPRLKEAMDKAGVLTKPDIQFYHIIRFDPNAKEKTWARVTYRVKDFDAWLKIYDGEGSATRATQGLIDVAVGRGVDDPNIVTMVFDIKEGDLAKAKAALTSEEKKKLRVSAGIEGTPKIEFYKSVD
jgi:hypothetical protein